MEIFGKKIDGVMILIAVLVIAGVSWGMVSVVNGMMAKGNNAISAQQSVLDKAQYEIYNATLVKGSQVLDCIKKSEKMFPNKVIIDVYNAYGDIVQYGWIGPDSYNSYYNNNPLSDYYINPTQSYWANINVNSNDVVTSIEFYQ